MAEGYEGFSLGRGVGRCKSVGRPGTVRPIRRAMLAAVLLAVVLCSVLAQSAGARTGHGGRLGYSLKPSKTMPYTPCPPGGRMIECNMIIDPPAVKTPSGYRLPSGGPLFEGGGELGGYDPSDLQSAYGIPSSGGTGETVALVDAYGYAAAEADMAKYREKYGLAACTKASGCFKKVNQKGEEKNYPPEAGELEKSWSVEAALDLDMVSAVCPSCHIMLVEATTQEPKDTAASAAEAATLSATEISNSYGYPENNETWCPEKKGCKEYLSSYSHAGIPVTVSSGDSGYDDGVGAPSWPATSPNVIAVGGTNLNKASNSRGWSETAWNASGSGCSLYETKPAWQFDAGCGKRTDNDVSAVASPSTPVSVYNSPVEGGWVNVGGTSASAPLIAGIEAHANSTTKTAAAEAFYKHPGMLFDVTTGNNGLCTPPAEDAYLCKSEPGYDGPTGWGTPNGVPHVSGWFTREIPNLAEKITAKNNSLAGMSCTFATECVAIGHYVNGPGTEVTLGESWNGTEWALMETPNPAGAKSSSLAGVSCKSGLFVELCASVGKYVNSSGKEVTLAETLTSGAWSIETSANPAEAKGSSLSGVSCATSESCIAVGRYVNSGGTEVTLAERYVSKKWTIVETPNPAEAKSSSLSGVSCISIGCIAVGHYVNSAGKELTLAEEILVVGKGTIQETPNPAEAKSSSLAGVSCASVKLCTATGHYVNSGGKEVTLGEAWNGTTWSTQETPNPTGAKSSTPLGIWCTSTEACTSVGHYVNSANTEVTLAEHWNATTWAVQETPNPKVATGSLSGMSCPSAAVCTAVGHYVTSAGTEVTLAEGWNGKEWSFQETPNPAEAKSASLSGVSCASTTACTAVGHYVTSAGKELTLAEVWASSKWTIKESLNPAEAKSASLSGVSCSASTACTAVGHYVSSGGTELTLAERWNGTTWAIQETVTPTGAKSSSLSGVSCASATVCTAVGSYVNSGNTEVTLVEGWNGTAWSTQESPNPAEAKSSSLSGVSCASTTACTAVGHYVSSTGKELTLAEALASAKWTIKESPNPAEAKSASLSGVSCAASTTCTAVGHYVNSGNTEVTLAEVWASSKWTIQETPNPTEAKSSSLSGVSCKTAETCIAAGHYTPTGGGLEVALVEEHA